MDKHARAERVRIRLEYRPDVVLLTVEDDGRGFEITKTPADSFGLGIMHERAARIGAELHIESRVGRGTRVALSWPASACRRKEGTR